MTSPSSYYDNTGEMTNSKFKGYLACPECQAAIDRDKYILQKECFVEGHYIEEMLIGDKDESKFPQIWKNSKSKYVKYDRYLAGIEQLNDKFLMELEGDHQKQVHFELEEMKWKGLIDIFDGQVRDLKTCAKPLLDLVYDIRYGMKVPKYIAYGYHYQLALYSFGAGTMDKGAKILSFVKETNPQQTEIIYFSPEMLQETLDEIRSQIPLLKEILNEKPKRRCGVCDYCKENYPQRIETAGMQYIIPSL